MKREQETKLTAWYNRKTRKPLVIRGARQVGKSTLVRRTAENLGVALWEINLERHENLDTVFSSFDIEKIIAEIGITTGMSGVGSTRGILFLDEIQAAPHAIAALRYFYEDRPDIAVIAAGSLLEFTLADYPYSMPVGRVEYLWIGPVNFLEFSREAVSEPVFEAYSSWIPGRDFSPNLHSPLLDCFRRFLLCGGMPEAAALFARSGDPTELKGVHRSILETYRDDFGKYAPRSPVSEIRKVFDFLPQGVGRKIRWSAISSDTRSAVLKNAFHYLVQAGIALPIMHSSASGIPLAADADESCIKPLFLDVGLMQSALNLPLLSLDEFSDSFFVNNGPRAEQFVGQELFFRDSFGGRPSLHYWLRESKSSNAEIDYLITTGASIIPVEVKSGNAGSLRSLHQFMHSHNSPFAIRFDLNMPSLHTVQTTIVTAAGKQEVSYPLLTLPLYLACRIDAIMEKISEMPNYTER